MKRDRNRPCPCESGRRYKHCCERREQAPGQRAGESIRRGAAYAIVPVTLAALAVLAVAAFRDGSEDHVPGGRVWSTAHGHWHVVNADGSQQEAQPGMVWSPEHGHWHPAAPLTSDVPAHVAADMAARVREAQEGIEQ